jgi:hypothetical protein
METITYINPKVDRSRWGSGPWDGEPDKKQWQDAATGLPCLAVRNSNSGHWCGYVGVPPSHLYYNKDYNDVEASVHGGLTFADRCQPGGECGSICHKAPEGEDDVWWLGFDCHHAFDLAPGHNAIMAKYGLTVSTDGTYRTLEYVENECKELAAQLAEAKIVTPS